MIFRYDFPADGFLAFATAVRQVRTERGPEGESVAESITRSRFSQRAVDLGEVVLTIDLCLESVTLEVPSAGIPPTELEGFPRTGTVRMERTGRLLEVPADLPVGRGFEFPDRDLEPGDSWQVEEALTGGQAVVEHTFQGWEGDLALFSSRAREYRSLLETGATLAGSLEGETWFDPAAGQVVRSLVTFATRVTAGDAEVLTQVSSQLDWAPQEFALEASL